jgi:G2/mitotic-specific cyclin 2
MIQRILTLKQARTVRQRAATNENDENTVPARMTRAKAATLGGPDELSEGMVKKALQSKKASSGALNAAQAARKRNILADVGNVQKAEAGEGKGKKSTTGRNALISKSTNAGIQKASQKNSKSSLTKDSSIKKRPASQVNGPERAIKKRATSSTSSQTILKDEEVSESQSKTLVDDDDVFTEPKVEEVKTEKIKVQESEEIVSIPPVEEVPDLDLEDLEDPLMVAEYAVEIFEYLRELEEDTAANPDYMEHQEHIEWSDRDVLNDWLVQVHQRFQLLPETFYLAINIIDRFLSTKIVQLDKLQLVGITALFIASKYEEVISPHISNFSYMAKDYPDSEILSAERFILQALNYNLSYPNPLNFLRRISKADNYDIQTRTLGKYLLEISMMDHRFLQFPSSQCAAAAMYMARLILNRGEWVCFYTTFLKIQTNFFFRMLHLLTIPTTLKMKSCQSLNFFSITALVIFVMMLLMPSTLARSS